AELCREASDPDPILHSFQDKEFLRIGIANLLGKTDVRRTTAALSDLTDTVLNQVADLVEPAVRGRYGAPMRNAEFGLRNPDPARDLIPQSEFRIPHCQYVLLGLGKLGGREISYHSDLDLLLVYEAEGQTDGPEPVPNSQFFTELAQRVIRAM